MTDHDTDSQESLLDTGLGAAEAARRLAEEGPNALPGGERRTLAAIALETLREPMFLLLLAAGTIYLVFGNRYFTPALLLVLLALKVTLPTVEHLLRPKPTEVPKDHPAWPMWFFADSLRFSAAFGNWFVVGLAADALLRAFAPGFWR